MGIAAYNRGSEVVRRQLDGIPDRHIESIDAIVGMANAVAKRSNACRLFTDVILRPGDNGAWWILGDPDPTRGWDAFGYYYASLTQVMADNLVEITEVGRDNLSLYFLATRITPSTEN